MAIDWKLKALWVWFEVFLTVSLVVRHSPPTPAPALLFLIVCHAVGQVTSVYWSVLHKGHGLTWQDAHMHTANAFVMLVELTLNALPVVASHALFVVLAGVGYLCWSLGVHAVVHSFIYPFLVRSAARAQRTNPLR